MRNEDGAEVIWAPFDLHPEYPPEGVPRPPSTGEMEARFADNGLAYDPPSIRANSLKALRLAEHARAEGLFDPMHARLMDAYWAEAQNIGALRFDTPEGPSRVFCSGVRIGEHWVLSA